MDIEEFRRRGKEIVDAIADYHMTLPQRRPWTDVRPGYLSELLPDSAPELPESWDDIRKDFDRAIIPGVRLKSVARRKLSCDVRSCLK